MAELRCEGLAKSYGSRRVLADVNLTVSEGTLTAILGASGSGKTTFLRVVIGFISPDRGSVSVGGTTVADAGGLHVPPDKRAIGYVAQEGALFPHLSVTDNVAFGLRRSERKRSSRTLEALELVGLDRSYAPRRPHELSGGEQRRVSLARALAPRPRLVLLDEPFSSLDAHLRAETREAVLAALQREGATAVLVTHDQAEALSMGHQVAVLRAGRLVQTAAPMTLYRTPVDLDVARFVGDAIVVPGALRAGRVECALGQLHPLETGAEGPVDVMIRPEQLRLLDHDAAPGAAARGVAADVVGHRYDGPDALVQLSLQDAAHTPVLCRTLGPDLPATGETVRLVVIGAVAVYPREATDVTSEAPRGASSPEPRTAP